MAWVCVDEDGQEAVFETKPYREFKYNEWFRESLYSDEMVRFKKGTIEKIIGRVLTWDDEPVEI